MFTLAGVGVAGVIFHCNRWLASCTATSARSSIRATPLNSELTVLARNRVSALLLKPVSIGGLGTTVGVTLYRGDLDVTAVLGTAGLSRTLLPD